MTETSKLSSFISGIKFKFNGNSDTFDFEKNTKKVPQNRGLDKDNTTNENPQLILDKLTQENNNLKTIMKHKNHYIKQLKRTIEILENSLENDVKNSSKSDSKI